ncbi:uncharacterized protein [Oscarella lobularis]|uniref:uncharacterized protein n=1 Tax=Oscarella lobularis TaxID=121494 RepID=UPI0033134CA1
MGESLRIESKMTAKVSDDDLKEINKKAIVKMNDLLAKTMDCTKYFPYLRSRSILDADDCEEIEAERTRRKKTFKFLAVLEEKSNYNLETVKRLIEAVSQDYTVPGLRDRMIDIFADARKDYLKKQGKCEEEEKEEEGEKKALGEAQADDVGPLPSPPPASSSRKPPPPNQHNTKRQPSSAQHPPRRLCQPVDDQARIDLPSQSSEDETRQSYMPCVDGTEQFDSSGPLPPTAANAMSAGTGTSTAREGVGGETSLTTDNSSLHSGSQTPTTFSDVTGYSSLALVVPRGGGSMKEQAATPEEGKKDPTFEEEHLEKNREKLRKKSGTPDVTEKKGKDSGMFHGPTSSGPTSSGPTSSGPTSSLLPFFSFGAKQKFLQNETS